MWKCIPVSLLLFSSLHFIHAVWEKPNVEQSFKISSNGFHGQASNWLRLSFGHRVANCTLAYRHSLPSGAYVDAGELPTSLLNRIWFAEEFDVEAPEWLSSEQTMLIYSEHPIMNSFTFEESWNFSVRLRYQHPVPGGGHVTVRFRSPDVLLRCLDSWMDASLPIANVPCFSNALILSERCIYAVIEPEEKIWAEAVVPRGNSNLIFVAVFATVVLYTFTAFVLLKQLFPLAKNRLDSWTKVD